jgi:hypothetical protein
MRPHSMFRINSTKQDTETLPEPGSLYRWAICSPVDGLPALIISERVNSSQILMGEDWRRGCAAARPVVNVARQLAAESTSIEREE